jgi:hypothetical protein
MTPPLSIKMLTLKTLVVAIAIPLIGSLSIHPGNAQDPNIEGNWKMSFNGVNITPTYTLIQKGTVLTGTFRSRLGEMPLTGQVKGNKINFAVKSKGKSLNFAGTINGETMSGVADLPQRGRQNWTASKY